MTTMNGVFPIDVINDFYHPLPNARSAAMDNENTCREVGS